MSLKKIILTSTFISCVSLGITTANAAVPGFYLGGQVGYGDTHYGVGDVNSVTSANIDDTGIAGRLFGGYQFNPNWAAELGYLQFSNTKYNNINGAGSDGKVRQHAIDLVGKGILPLDNGFGFYGKLGLAYLRASAADAISGSSNKINPEIGVGASYDITPNVPIDISWSHIQKMGGSIPNADFFSAGIAYNFG